MNKGKPGAQGSQTAQQMAFSWLLYFSWHLSESFSATLCVRPAVVAGTRVRLPVWMCWGMSNAGAIHSPSFSLSFKKKSWVWKFSHLPEELTTSSIQFNGFQSPTKNTGQREFENFFFLFIFFFFLLRVCVLKLQKKGMWEVKRDTYHKSWIVLPLTIRCICFQTFLYACIIFKKQGWELFCSCFEACWFFSQHIMAIS